MMFLGTYEPKLDDKGRVILPARFREDMEGGIVLTRGQEHCIYAFPAQEFEQMTVELRRAPLSSKQARDYIRVLLSGAYKEVPDKQGRITLPPDLRKYAGLDRELTVIGAGSRAEIWNSQAWNDYLSVQEDVFSQTENEIIPGMF
ncbi:protein MraZ [Actinomyces sp. oral taxon 181 str. F0379]|jgi:protein mraZ|nr:protein MraZ [Actinomyces sp. oral taxon 181 str. F0379]